MYIKEAAVVSYMGFISSISQHSFLIGLVVIVLFIGYQFMSRGKVKNPVEIPIPELQPGEKDTAFKRMKRGFLVIVNKFRNSQYIQDMQEAQQTKPETKTDSKKEEKKRRAKEDNSYMNTNDIFAPLDF